MRKFRAYACAAGLAALSAGHAAADDYTLLDPVPDDKLRAMSTERPSKTDSAVTVDAGHYQLETSLYTHAHNDTCFRGHCTELNESSIDAITDLRIGLTQAMDLQIVSNGYDFIEEKDKTTGASKNIEGFGDTTLRLKYNLWGNDGGATALSVLPYVKLPTSQHGIGNDDVEYGFEVPFAINLPNNWSVNAMTQYNLLKKQDASGYYGGYANSAALGKNFTSALSGYAELYTFKPDHDGLPWQNSADFGVVYAVNANLHVDTGVNLGLTGAADKADVFVGAAYRF